MFSWANLKRYLEVALVFLKLGLTAFGGPAAHISMMDQEFVRRRQWLTRPEFLDLLAAVSLIPGPSSTQMTIFIGYRRAGWVGLLLGGLCFILPAMLLVTAIASLYVRYGTLPQGTQMLYWIKPVIIAIVTQALWGLSKTAVKSRRLAFLGVVAIGFSLMGTSPLTVLFGAGLLMMLTRLVSILRDSPGKGLPFMSVLLLPTLGTSSSLGGGAAASAIAVGAWPLFFFFLKIGTVLYGSGYVLLAILQADLVDRWHWLSSNQLLDAVAVGQITPGPLFTTATFIGYLLAGKAGALVATVGIFLPSFLMVAVSGPFIPRLRHWSMTAAFLDGVNVASLALMGVVTWELGKAALVNVPTVSLAVVSAFLLIRYKMNSAWLVLGSALLGGVISCW